MAADGVRDLRPARDLGHYSPNTKRPNRSPNCSTSFGWSRLGEDVAEYLPAGNDPFFIREGDLGTITFSRDAQGHVTGYAYHRVDGQEIHAKKIK
jgi:hypothetical protein